MLDRINMIRRQCALELTVVPVIRIRDNLQLRLIRIIKNQRD